MIRRILYAFGGDGNVAITRPEAEVLFEINDATADGTNAEGWRDLFVKAIANCVLAASMYTAPSREQALTREAWLDRRGDLSVGAMAEGMARGLGDRPWLHGIHMSLADIAVGCALGYLDFRFPQVPWRERHPQLAQYQSRLMQRQSFVDTQP